MSKYTKQDCIKETKEHIQQVRNLLDKSMNELLSRYFLHDKSKLESPELEIFTEYTPKLKETTYGSDEYKKNLEGMKTGLSHHYAHNSHHPEHYKKYVCNICFAEYEFRPDKCSECYNGQFQEEADISQMDLFDLVEMICDWKAATMRHNDGDIIKSLEVNQKRFGVSEQLQNILEKTVERYFNN